MSIEKKKVSDSEPSKDQARPVPIDRPDLKLTEPTESVLDPETASAAEPDDREAAMPPVDLNDLFRKLVQRANRGDKESLKALRILLDRHPQIWRRAGDLAAVAEGAWIELIAGHDKLAAESIRRTLAELKTGLAGERPTPLEHLLIEHAGITWLAAQEGEIQATDRGGSLGQAAMRLKRAESGQRRFLGAVKTLTTLRALVPRGMVPVEHLNMHRPNQARA